MMDFQEDGNGLFEMYYNYCNVNNDDVLTPQDEVECQIKLTKHIFK